MKKCLLFSLIMLLAAPIFAQIQKGTAILGENFATYQTLITDTRNDSYDAISRTSTTPKVSYFLKDNLLLSAQLGRGQQDFSSYTYDPNGGLFSRPGYRLDSRSVRNEYPLSIGARYYLPQNNRNRFFIDADIAVNLTREVENKSGTPDFDYDEFDLKFTVGTNRKVREELYFEGGLSYTYSDIYSHPHPNRGIAIPFKHNLALRASFVNFATFNPKSASKAGDIFQKGTAIISGGAVIVHSLNSPYTFFSIAPNYLLFLNERVAVGGGISLEIDNDSNFDYTNVASSISPTLRYHFVTKTKYSLYTQGGFAYSQLSNWRDKIGGSNYRQRLGLNLELGMDIFIGDGLAFEPKIFYGRQTPYYENGSNTFGLNVGMKYFLKKK